MEGKEKSFQLNQHLIALYSFYRKISEKNMSAFGLHRKLRHGSLPAGKPGMASHSSYLGLTNAGTAGLYHSV